MNAIKEKAYAKINLFLNVTGKRDDGFHEVRTVMHTVSLCDEVTVSVQKAKAGSVTMDVFPSCLPTDEKNLCVMSAYEFLRVTGLSYHVHISLKKKIPISRGLAGGSSDGAATLRALNRLLRKPLGERELLKICQKLGSDVTYCYFGKTALCLGRGEKIERLDVKKSYNFVIASANEHVSTPRAYQSLDALFGDFSSCREEGKTFEETLMKTLSEDEELPVLYNVFERAILPTCPGAETLKTKLYELGATSVLMSGSGPSVFGVFVDELRAKHAETALKNDGYFAVFATSV